MRVLGRLVVGGVIGAGAAGCFVFAHAAL
jgi:hypothetical protein